MDHNNKSATHIKRRDLLKMLTASGIAAGAAMLLPDEWVKPAIADYESEQAIPEAIDAITLVRAARTSVYNMSWLNTSYCIPTVLLNFSFTGSPVLNSTRLILNSNNFGTYNAPISAYGGAVHYNVDNISGQITLPYPGQVASGTSEVSNIRVMLAWNNYSNYVYNNYTVTCTPVPTAVNVKEVAADEWSAGPTFIAAAGAAALSAAAISQAAKKSDSET